MTIEIHELVIRAEVSPPLPTPSVVSFSRQEQEKLIALVVEQVMRELRYRQEKQL
ncbi:DUF5908 family protein [Escherichia sp. E1130]|uniref:DUF5908 family protein n=1 Tax=Escherichia sp. E1130 TaxID=2041645 RepID=UPI0014367297|nr:DUF5908 family protein [Escherichia sp. E1130]